MCGPKIPANRVEGYMRGSKRDDPASLKTAIDLVYSTLLGKPGVIFDSPAEAVAGYSEWPTANEQTFRIVIERVGETE